jgi:Zn-finger nucleic acid-binding protein
MQCPKCQNHAPDFNTKEGVMVNFCDACHGLWFDQGELALYCETQTDVPHIASLVHQAQATAYSCPRCLDRTLVELPYMAGEDVLIDWCPVCHGAWLDPKELGKIERLATRFETHTARLNRGIAQLEQAGYTILGIRRAGVVDA